MHRQVINVIWYAEYIAFEPLIDKMNYTQPQNLALKSNSVINYTKAWFMLPANAIGMLSHDFATHNSQWLSCA